jgi:CHASE1-domain containing sensor protein
MSSSTGLVSSESAHNFRPSFRQTHGREVQRSAPPRARAQALFRDNRPVERSNSAALGIYVNYDVSRSPNSPRISATRTRGANHRM